MKVSEMIKKLQKLPPNEEVYYFNYDLNKDSPYTIDLGLITTRNGKQFFAVTSEEIYNSEPPA